jgi:hypothetical protein
MLWKHIHECIKKRQEYNPTTGLNQEELAVVSIANNR